MINCVHIVFATLFLIPIPTPLHNLVNNSPWKPKICRLTLLQERPHHVFALDKKKYHQSASALHPSAPLLIYYVMIFFGSRLGLGLGCYTVVRLSKLIVLISFLQHYPSHPHRHPRQISLTIRVGNRVYASSHSFKITPNTSSPRTRRNITHLPVLYTLVRL